MSALRTNILALAALIEKGTIGTSALNDAGKLPPAKAPDEEYEDEEEEEDKCSCGKSSAEDCKCVAKSGPVLFVPISKASDEEQTITGVVMQPEVPDAVGDITGADVIKAAAHKFLANYNKKTKLGKQHNDFANWQKRFALVESYIAPMEFALGDKIVKSGSWLMTWKVLNKSDWKQVKDNKITGFSIGGKAKIQTLEAPAV